jgi:hypothetical protein
MHFSANVGPQRALIVQVRYKGPAHVMLAQEARRLSRNRWDPADQTDHQQQQPRHDKPTVPAPSPVERGAEAPSPRLVPLSSQLLAGSLCGRFLRRQEEGFLPVPAVADRMR